MSAEKLAVLFDDMMRDPKGQAVLGQLARQLPSHIVDQWVASAEQADDLARAIAAGSGGDFTEGDFSTQPLWLTLSVWGVITRFHAGAVSTCLHSPKPTIAQPVMSCAWKPDLITCPQCTHLFRLLPGSDADRRCDRCGRVTEGVASGDGIHTNSVAYTSVIYTFGLCVPCQTEWRAGA